jgi:hypothetical protein
MCCTAEGRASLFQIPSGISVFSFYRLLSMVHMEVETYITVVSTHIYYLSANNYDGKNIGHCIIFVRDKRFIVIKHRIIHSRGKKRIYFKYNLQ